MNHLKDQSPIVVKNQRFKVIEEKKNHAQSK